MRDLQKPGAVLRAALVYFCVVFGAGFVLGSVRVPLLVPRLGERLAELIEMPFMLVAMFWASGYIVRRYGSAVGSRGWVVAGLAALGLLVGAEVLLAVLFAGAGFLDYIASRDPVSGGVYLVMLLVMAALPWLRRGQAARGRCGAK